MIQQAIDLAEHTTFGVHAKAAFFTNFSDEVQLSEILSKNDTRPLLILGGGSNILFTTDFNGLVLKNEVKGIRLVNESSSHVIMEAGAGENWHQFVLHCISNGWGGIENLSLIPGNVGASPMQNIGAYGREIKDVFHSLDAYRISDGTIHTFTNEECKFGYRESVFKGELRDQFVILRVRFELDKHPIVNTSYGAIESELNKQGISAPTIRDVSNAVIAIRTSKLPDPNVLGNAGSFFKNPVVPEAVANKITHQFPGAPVYDAAEGYKKLAAGWLIEQAGWKGKKLGSCGVNDLQALVLVNFGGATGKEIFDLSTAILDAVHAKFGVVLEREVNIL
jgi:UDP-N-acetylmuramate dehydrogenase